MKVCTSSRKAVELMTGWEYEPRKRKRRLRMASDASQLIAPKMILLT